ncbi:MULTISPECIES: sensor histidine kinase [Allobacillus]|uniref:histidine kinase n=1 Tax=Allobacillus salarius TaxID=1955272 RepID=A0A556PKY3_9BACI|nr:sensor histidine kinase [Allobacillus salarius]TSJ65051.1 sensor histidine kinase [Allobacillus salarius]
MASKFSLQTKIMTMLITLLFIVTFSLTAINSYIEYNQIKDHMGQRALDVATSISLMPEVIKAFDDQNPTETIQPIVEDIRKRIGSEFIVVGDAESTRIAHPETHKIGKKMVGGDNDKALVHGEYYKSEAVGSLGPSLRGKAPIINQDGQIIGIVSVGFMIEDIKGKIFDRLNDLFLFSLLVLLIGAIGGIFLARSIRKDILGLEPREIVSLYRDRKAVLRSVKEGIIAVDQNGMITLLNHSARKMLGLDERAKYKHIEEVLPNTKMQEVLRSGEPHIDEEIILRDRHVIVNRIPLHDNGETVGVVASFRDKTEMQQMINALSEVKSYSEDLRAQTHEFTNKLYVLSGLLQLGHYQEAIDLIQEESYFYQQQTKSLFEHIKDEPVQAILLGKLGKASEKKIEFTVDENSQLDQLPEHLTTSKLTTILGNLFDNAMDAVQAQEDRQVTFFATDLGKDIIFEVSDNGPGIPEDKQTDIFSRGFSTKEKNRGFGLPIVEEVVADLQGTISFDTDSHGTVFTVYLPKILSDQQSEVG